MSRFTGSPPSEAFEAATSPGDRPDGVSGTGRHPTLRRLSRSSRRAQPLPRTLPTTGPGAPRFDPERPLAGLDILEVGDMLARIRVECGPLPPGAVGVWGIDPELCLRAAEPRQGPFLDAKAVERARREARSAGWPEVCGVPACRASRACRGGLRRFREVSSATPCRILDMRLTRAPWTLSPQEIPALEIVRPLLSGLVAKGYGWFGLKDGSWTRYMPARTAEWTAMVLGGAIPYPDDPAAMPLRAPPDAAWKAIGLKKRPFRREPSGLRPLAFGLPEPLLPERPKPRRG